MRILIATTQVPFTHGGAEAHAAGLRAALCAHGHQAEIVAIPFAWTPLERVLDHMLACRLLDVSQSHGEPVDLLIALKFPVHLLPHPRKVIWLLHEFRTAYALWSHDSSDLVKVPRGALIRDAIRSSDRQAFGEAQAVFTNSQTVSRRLQPYHAAPTTPLYHPPPHAGEFQSGPAGDYFFFPSRLNESKRQMLALEALAHTKHPVRLRFAGRADREAFGPELARRAGELGVSARVEWLGEVSHAELRAHYAGALGVLFPPLDEDYGYVTLEAMLSAKPVVTCRDSGGPNEFVLEDETGFSTAPEPEAIADRLDELWENRGKARRMGLAGRERYDGLGLSWEVVVEKLCAPV